MSKQIEIEAYMRKIINVANKDNLHLDNPQNQIDTLAIMVGKLLNTNENNKYDELIGFYTHIGRSLKELIKLQNLNNKTNG